ncbi:related to NAD binding Rossmann fold oxidoreductase [Phialocephala subalpina]|uniref:Related to NAD binding Rossmann fold oxidoreductase n=1 Tax=Phialocephala subalpina TaxID=576137 RepID=A0A1L7WBG5_9HELO|nr:related to NAD binding Rossmann fold oxidoreductase [Phialocephala subalpina]
MSSTQSPQKLRVGVLGAGEVAQVIHLPTLSLLNHLYSVVSICDISQQTVDHVGAKFDIPHKTIHAHETISHLDVDLIMILTADEFHESLCISALQVGKLVFIEKPITLSIPSVQRILEAEKAAGGNRIFVGYMRRYAPSFTQAFLREVASIPKIVYARSRDIVGPNAHFVGQSGTSPVKFTDFPPGAAQDRKVHLDKLFLEVFQGHASKRDIQYCRFLGSLGSHDLSLMHEALGFPESVAGVSANEPFYSAIFNYRNKTGEPYSVTYESGIDSVPRFDANLAVYGERKTVSIQYDTPYVKGLPIKVKVEELNETGEATSREILSSFEDAYTVELKEMYECFVNGKAIKTTAADASKELELFDMMYKQLAKQG